MLIYRSALGTEDRAVGSTSFHLARLLHKKGRFEEAEPLYRNALAVYEKSCGPEHSETANVMGMLAVLVEINGDPSGAKLLLGRAYNIAAKALGESHPTTLKMKTRLNALMLRSEPTRFD